MTLISLAITLHEKHDLRAGPIVKHAQQAVQCEHELKMLFPGSQVCWHSQHKMAPVMELNRKLESCKSCLAEMLFISIWQALFIKADFACCTVLLSASILNCWLPSFLL